MKHKFLSFLLLMISMAALLSVQAGAADAVDAFAEDMRAFKTEITVSVRDFDALMKETFTRYPELYLYYSTCSYRSNADGLTMTMAYRNTQVSEDNIYVVDSREEMVAAVGLALCDLKTEIEIILANGFTMTLDEFWAVFEEVERDYYLIYMGAYSRTRTAWEAPEYGVGYYHLQMEPYYPDTSASAIQYWRDATEQKVLELAQTLFAQDMPDYQKAYLIHDWLVDNNFYDMADFDKLQWENHIAYGTLCEGNGVCQSYAEAARMLCEAAGIPCCYVPGYGTNSSGDTESHAWNCLQLDGEWYLWDATWDDPVTGDGSNVKRYDYFLITSEQMRKDHVWEEADFPTCTATELNYDRVMELIAADTNAYTDYSTRNVRTQAMMRAELEEILYGKPQEEPVEQPEEPVEEPEEPVEQPEEPVEQPEEPVEQPEEPAIEPIAPEELEPVVKLDKQKQQEYIQLNWMALLIGLALFAAVTAIALHCAANSRVSSARSERQEQRRQRLLNSVRTRRRF